eukprot:TRINITY_DN11215_c0_g6_i1.p2 TRINITY_DN11215_c0_g6~~TRINITY_DN11215_c0_g6_i1.p2  ORF type:complete len:338 (+),score=137.50 TRINITY_DN11215_c0_g6_i1:88-1014(+)
MVRVAVVGSGMMGRGIAACCASGGPHEVRMFDVSPSAVQQGVPAAQGLQRFLSDNGVAAAQQGTITGAATLAEALRDVDFVFEAILEDVQVKNRFFKEAEQLVPPGCVLCTNTSSLSVTAIADGMATAHRFCAAHYIGPAHLVPLVELCPAKQTGPDAVPRVKAFLESIGKKPVVLKKEIQGFLAARLQAALYRECMHLYTVGVADPAAIDGAVVDGFGRRLNQIGPFTVVDFAGVDLVQKTHATFFPQLGDYKRDLRCDELMAKGRHGVKNGKGNYNWPADVAKATMARRDAELLRRLKEDRAKAKL